MYFKSNGDSGMTLRVDRIESAWIENNNSERGKYKIVWQICDNTQKNYTFYKTRNEAERDLELFHKNKTGRKFMQEIKNYFRKHQDTFITLAIIILVDQFVFSGKFANRLKDMMESLISKTEKMLLSADKVEGSDEQ